MNGDELDTSASFTQLGLFLSSNLTWKTHIHSLAKHASKKLGFLARARGFFSSSHLLSIYKSQICPSLEYCSHVWGGAPKSTLCLLDKVQSKAIRLINNPNLAKSLQPLSHRRLVGDNSALNFLAQTFQAIGSSKLYVDLPAYLSLCIVTGDSLRPDLLLISPNNCLNILELTVGFETNLDINSHRKEEKYRPLLKDLNCDYRQVQFVSLSISCLGIFGQSSDSFLEMCKCIGIDQSYLNYILNKISSIIIRTTYYIFCSRNKPWSNPELFSY